MYRLEREDIVRSRFQMLWALLGFQAGFINTFAFLACGRYVSHITGFGTQIGSALLYQDFSLAFQLLSFPISFICGSFVSAFFTSARLEREKVPYYSHIALLLPVILVILVTLDSLGIFSGGDFGANALIHAHDWGLVLTLVFASGLQNGCFTVLTKGAVRTTHLTGTSTDLGIDLSRQWFGKLHKDELRLTKLANLLRLAILFSFAAGAIAAGVVSLSLGYAALIIPTLTSILAFFSIKRVQRLIEVRGNRVLRKSVRANESVQRTRDQVDGEPTDDASRTDAQNNVMHTDTK